MLVDPLTGVPAGVLTMVTVYWSSTPVVHVQYVYENNDDHCTQLMHSKVKAQKENIKCYT